MAISLTLSDTQLLAKVAPLRPKMERLLLEWASQNSGSDNRDGLQKMRAKLETAFGCLEAEITDASLPQGQQVTKHGVIEPVDYEPALLITQRPDAPIQIVLTGHYDTVFPPDYHFQNCTYLDDNTINGPGTADMKGGILVMLHALELFEQSEMANQVGYSILLSPDEEIGSPGSAEPLARLGSQSHIGLTFEPALADGSLAGARKGSGNFALIIHGKAAHAGREHHIGRNAIAAMARFVTRLDALNGQREGVTFNIAKIDGGGASNIVPELAIGRFNVRMTELSDMDWIEAQIAGLIEEVRDEDGITAELTGGFTRPPKPMAPANAEVFNWVKQAGDALGLPIRWAPSGGVCEGNNLWASGCPNVDTLGVCGGNIHSDQEFIKLESLTDRVSLTLLILLKVASGTFDARAVKAMALQDIGKEGGVPC